MPLTDAAIRNAKPKAKIFKLYDSGGLYLDVSPSGGKWWRFKYRFEGKEKRLSLGVYPEVSLSSARERRDKERRLLSDHIDPSKNRKAEKSIKAMAEASSFEQVTREWFEKFSPSWAPAHAKRKLRLFERDLFPWIGKLAISEITAPDLLGVLRRMEKRGVSETVRRGCVACGQVFRYAVAAGRATTDPTDALRDALPPVRTEHFAATTDPDRLGGILRAFDGYEGTLTVRCALRLMPLVFVRPGELRNAHWEDIDLDAREWRYVASKRGPEHIVPLSLQAMSVLSELYPVTGEAGLVFPSARSSKRPMSDNAILAAMRSMGIPKEVMTGHGFRAVARTILDEVLGFRPDIIEHQLAHAVKDPNGRAYNRTAFLAERKVMMQSWADHLDKLKCGKLFVIRPLAS